MMEGAVLSAGLLAAFTAIRLFLENRGSSVLICAPLRLRFMPCLLPQVQ